jgi:hypothetical protein
LYQPWIVYGDDCGEISGKKELQENPRYWEKTCPIVAVNNRTPMNSPGLEPGSSGGKPSNNRLTYTERSNVQITKFIAT